MFKEILVMAELAGTGESGARISAADLGEHSIFLFKLWPSQQRCSIPWAAPAAGAESAFSQGLQGSWGGFLSVKATPSTYLQRKELSQTTAGECRTPRSPQHRWAPVAGLCEAFRLLSPLRGSVAVLGCPTGRASWAISERSPPASLSGQS